MIGLITLFGFFNGSIKSTIEGRLSALLGAEVTIESLEGNPFFEFSLSRIEIADSGRVVFECGEAVVSYRPVSLLWGNVVIDSLRLVSPRLTLIQDASSGGFGLTRFGIPSIDLQSIIVQRGIVSIGDSEDSLSVDNLDLELGFKQLAGEMALQVRRLKTVVLQPPLEISNLTGLALTRDDVLLFQDIKLATPHSSIVFNGQVTGLSDPHFRFEVASDSLDLQELGVATGVGLPAATTWFSAKLEGTLAEYGIELDWVVGGAAGDAELHIMNGNFPAHRLEVHGREVDLSTLAGVPLRGDFHLVGEGDGLTLLDAVGEARASISAGSLYGIPVDSVVSQVRYARGQASGGMALASDIGAFLGSMRLSPEHFDVRGHISDVDLVHAGGPSTLLDGELTAWADAQGTFNLQLDLNRLLIDNLDTGDLSAAFERSESAFKLTSLSWVGRNDNFRVNGKGDVWRKHDGLFSLAFDGVLNPASTFEWLDEPRAGVPMRFSTTIWSESLKFGATQELMSLSADLGGFCGLDTLEIVASANGGRISIERFEGSGEEASLMVDGEIIQGSAFDLEGTYTVSDVSVIPEVLRYGSSGTNLRLVAGVVGPWETPEITVESQAELFEVAGGVFEGLRVDSKMPTGGEGGVSLQSEVASWAGRTLNGFYVDIGTAGAEVSFLVGCREGGENRVSIWGGASTFTDSLSVRVDSAYIQFQDEFVANRGPISLSHSSKTGIRIHQLHLVGPSGELEAASHGPGGAIDVRVHEFDIAPWGFLLGLDDRIDGILSGGLSIEGGVDDLSTQATFQVVGARIDSFRADTIYSDVSHKGNRVLGKVGAKAGPGDLFVEGTMELDRADPNREVDLRILANRFPLSSVDGFWTQVTEIAGELTGEVWLSGSAKAVSARGELSVVGGEIRIPSLNRGLTALTLDALVSPSGMTLSRFEGVGVAGSLEAKGQIGLAPLNLDRVIEDPILGDLDLQLTAVGLDASGTADVQAVIEGTVQLSGTLQGPILVGGLVLQKAELRLLSMLEAPSDPESIWLTVPFFENLQCELQLSAERQLWIRDEAVNVELAGDIDILRNLDDVSDRLHNELGFRFFGGMESLRGTYRFQSRNFRIVQGGLSFQGEPQVNPVLDIEARSRIPIFVPGKNGDIAREEMNLAVLVSGSFTQPEILMRDEADDEAAQDQARLLSFLLFGRAPDQLIAAEQNVLGEQSAGLVLGLATRELQSRIADRLNLDVVQVEMGSASSISSVRVGKYINDRLFVTYEDQIGQGREFTVKYELLPRFSLESTTVVDPDKTVAPSLRLTWSKDW